jgi:N-methylhydantoinase A
MGPYRLGVDIGGTFTDFALLDENTGRIQALKYPSDRERPAASVFSGLAALGDQYGVSTQEFSYFTHGTTLAVNTILQYSGAKCALFVTRGLRDILYLGRHRLPDIFNFFTQMPTPLVPRSRVIELDERCLASGRLAIPIDEEQVRDALERLVADEVESVAVGFLHSYQNPDNELAVARIAAEVAPRLFVSLSSQVWPQMREYERTLISTMNAYVGGRMEAYFSDLETGLRTGGLVAPVLSTKSNGGLMTAQEAARRPVDTLMSGPAAGAIGAAFVGRAAGYDRLITLDMGGTSTDISIVDGTPRYSTENQIGDFPVIMPAVDVTSIGAGGGSIAWLDTSGMLKVGPQSAGAVPGPACYGLGSTEPTLTDAYVCLGIIEPGDFAGGKVTIDREKAMAAVARLAEVMDSDVEEVAESIIRIATSHIFAVLVPLLARKGVNYEEFALLPFGGAGAMHGFLAAREIGIRRVIVPLHPGVLCAIGALVADVRRDFVRTVHQSFRPSAGGHVIERLRRAFRELEIEGDRWLDSQGLNYVDRHTIWSVDMRYLGQSFEISVPIERQVIGGPDDGLLRRAFYEQYRLVYGHADETAEIEVRDVRVGAVGITSKPKLELIANPVGEHDVPQGYRKPIFHDGRLQQALVLERNALSSGIQLDGPVIIKQYDTTTFVPSGYRISVDDYGNLIGESDDEQ